MNPQLCRNCKPIIGKPDTTLSNEIPEQEWFSVVFCPYCLGRGIFMSENGEQGPENMPPHINEEFCRVASQERAMQLQNQLEYAGYDRPEHTPIGLDPISTAREFEMNARIYGPESPEAQAAYEVLRNDVRTALFEGLIERGHISVTESQWDEGEQGFKMGGLLYRDLLARAFDSRLVKAEHERRQVEMHEELFIEELYKSGLLEGKALLTISPFPDDLTGQWAKDLGYKESTRKFMMRWVQIEDGVRTTKQISMSGSDTKVLSRFLRQNGFIGANDLSATEILNTPVIVEPDQFGDIIDVARGIDEINGPGVFLGGKPNGDTYETLERQSRAREHRLASSIDGMAYELIKVASSVAKGDLPEQLAADAYAHIILKTRNAICAVEPEMARETIGEKAYNKYKEVQIMIQNGCSQIDIDAHLAEAERDSEPMYVCGESIGANGKEGSGEEGGHCAEIKNGQMGQCPGCKHTVAIIVEGAKKDKLYCPRNVCKLSKVGGKKKPESKKEDKAMTVFNEEDNPLQPLHVEKEAVAA